MNKYIKYIPKPLLQDIVENRCIPFVGAGFSKNADSENGINIPNWEELGNMLAEQINDYEPLNAIDAISTYENEFSRISLIEKLKTLLISNKIKPGNTHRAFCNLQFDVVCTTNIDFLLEQEYNNLSKLYYTIIDESHLSISCSRNEFKLVKFHGDLNNPNNLVLSEDDYDSFLIKKPLMATYLSNLLIERTPLFIGYSIEDSDFRQIWQIIKNRLGKLRRQAYVLKVGCKQYEEERYRRRGVKVINLPGKIEDYPSILKDTFEEIGKYWNDNLLTISPSNDYIQAEMSMPEDAMKRFCFFSVPFQLLPFYKRYIYPVIKSLDLLPVSADDILSVGDNIFANISSLISKAEFFVIDIDSKYSVSDLCTILNKKENFDNILVVQSKNSEPMFNTSQLYRISKDIDSIDDDDVFAKLSEQIRDWLGKQNNIKDNYNDEPNRLLKKKEYKAATIAAFTLFEIRIREKIEKKIGYTRFPPNIYSKAFDNEIINSEQYLKIQQWRRIRNELVHTSYVIDSKTANEIVNGINQIIKWIDNH